MSTVGAVEYKQANKQINIKHNLKQSGSLSLLKDLDPQLILYCTSQLVVSKGLMGLAKRKMLHFYKCNSGGVTVLI